MLKSFRYVLFPFSILYGGVIFLRNKLYDKKILRSVPFNFPLICVGNLAVGGTGKTPMVEYLIELLKDDYKIATLSRGYKRKTTGFALANAKTTALDIGDEPMQFHKKFPGIAVAVSEDRLVAIPELLYDRPDTKVIILDDAFQHRRVKAGLNIMLTEQKNLYTRDFVLPAGDLRDIQDSSKRADIIIVTKCSAELSVEEKNKLVNEIQPLPAQRVYFSKIEYGTAYHLYSNEKRFLNPETHILLITGIANPKPLKEMLTKYFNTYDMLSYRDHHIFSMGDLTDIKRQFDRIEAPEKIILTTEKDGMRLMKFENELKDTPIYILPMKHKILFEEEEAFNTQVLEFVSRFQVHPDTELIGEISES
jgi:tetraacyldisaccharide 4'-kinase